MREERRAQIVGAFAQVLAEHGYAGATINAVAARAGITPGLVHHHFADKDDLLESLLALLVARFRERIDAQEQADPLEAYIDAALALDERADVIAARCWVGVFAEAIRNPTLFSRVRRLIDTEIGDARCLEQVVRCRRVGMSRRQVSARRGLGVGLGLAGTSGVPTRTAC